MLKTYAEATAAVAKYYGLKAVKWTGATVAALHVVSPHYMATEATVKYEVASKVEAVTDSAASMLGYVKPAPAVPERTWKRIADEQAEMQGVNKCLVRSVIKIESVNGTRLISPAGALGHMQLMRDTARGECDIKSDSDRLDPEQNIYCGVKHLKKLIKQYGLFKGLQVYNAGPNRVGMTEENRLYPHKVLDEWSVCTETEKGMNV